MFEVVHSWFGRASNPVGIDFGTDCLRMAQVEMRGHEPRLVAAASVDVPAPVRDDPAERLIFFTDALADLLRTEHFRGRQAVLALPAACTFIQHLQLPQLEDSQTREAVLAAVNRMLPVDARDPLVRHQAVQEFGDGGQEIIAVGAARSHVVDLLAAAQEAGVDVIAMNTEPGAYTDFYSHVYRRYSDRTSTTGIVDIGYAGTRIMVIRDQKLVMARALPFGGRHLTQAVADAMHMSADAARMLRLKHSRTDATAVSLREQHVVFVAPSAGGIDAMQREHCLIEHACKPVLDSLCRALEQARLDFEVSEVGSKIGRLLFVGGESRDRRLCERIARYLGVTAATGDPLLRMGRNSNVCVDSGIDRRQPQPAWAVAIGLSLGPVNAEDALESEDQQSQDPLRYRQ